MKIETIKQTGKQLTGMIATASVLAALSAAAAHADGRDVELSPGFTPDPKQRSYISGGGNDASSEYGEDVFGNSCIGHIADTPDHRMTLTDDFDYLRIWNESDGDTTLVIDGPGFLVFCDDDSGSGLNELIEANDWPAGTYDIYVGSYGSGDFHRYDLFFSELPFVGP